MIYLLNAQYVHIDSKILFIQLKIYKRKQIIYNLLLLISSEGRNPTCVGQPLISIGGMLLEYQEARSVWQAHAKCSANKIPNSLKPKLLRGFCHPSLNASDGANQIRYVSTWMVGSNRIGQGGFHPRPWWRYQNGSNKSDNILMIIGYLWEQICHNSKRPPVGGAANFVLKERQKYLNSSPWDRAHHPCNSDKKSNCYLKAIAVYIWQNHAWTDLGNIGHEMNNSFDNLVILSTHDWSNLISQRFGMISFELTGMTKAIYELCKTILYPHVMMQLPYMKQFREIFS